MWFLESCLYSLRAPFNDHDVQHNGRQNTYTNIFCLASKQSFEAIDYRWNKERREPKRRGGKDHKQFINVLNAESFMADIPAVSAREVTEPVQNIASNTPMEVISFVEFLWRVQ